MTDITSSSSNNLFITEDSLGYQDVFKIESSSSTPFLPMDEHNHDHHHPMDDATMSSSSIIHDNDHNHHLHHHAATTLGGDDATPANFCKGMPMVMYMDGFQWALRHASTSSQHGCLSFYFPSWVLDTREKFLLACLVVFCLGVWCEAVSRWRHDVSQRIKRMSARMRTGTNTNYNSNSSTQSAAAARSTTEGTIRRQQQYKRRLIRLWYAQTFLHGLSGLCAYLLMLATMTYSLEFLFAVVLGLMTGYFTFGGDAYKHAGGSPCCAIFDNDDEATVATMTHNDARSRGDGDHSSVGIGGTTSSQDLDLGFPPQNILSDPNDVVSSSMNGGYCCEDDADNNNNNADAKMEHKDHMTQPLLHTRENV